MLLATPNVLYLHKNRTKKYDTQNALTASLVLLNGGYYKLYGRCKFSRKKLDKTEIYYTFANRYKSLPFGLIAISNQSKFIHG